MSGSRNRVELMHQVSVLYNWAIDERDTISALSEKTARKAVIYLAGFWPLVERRRKGSRFP